MEQTGEKTTEVNLTLNPLDEKGVADSFNRYVNFMNLYELEAKTISFLNQEFGRVQIKVETTKRVKE